MRIAGVGQGTDTLAVRHRQDLTSFRATQVAAKTAFSMAGFGPERIDVAEVRDAFAPFELIALEDIGLVRLGAASRATLEIVTFTTLYSPPEGFRSPLHIAIVELEGGARFVCHGEATKGIRIGSHVSIEAVDRVYYFAHLGALDRARLFWRRAGRRSQRLDAIARSWAKRIWKGRGREASD